MLEQGRLSGAVETSSLSLQSRVAADTAGSAVSPALLDSCSYRIRKNLRLEVVVAGPRRVNSVPTTTTSSTTIKPWHGLQPELHLDTDKAPRSGSLPQCRHTPISRSQAMSLTGLLTKEVASRRYSTTLRALVPPPRIIKPNVCGLESIAIVSTVANAAATHRHYHNSKNHCTHSNH